MLNIAKITLSLHNPKNSREGSRGLPVGHNCESSKKTKISSPFYSYIFLHTWPKTSTVLDLEAVAGGRGVENGSPGVSTSVTFRKGLKKLLQMMKKNTIAEIVKTSP